MTILKNIRAKNQVRYDEAGEGVGRSDPMEGMKKQKGEVTKQIEQYSEAIEHGKRQLGELRNKISTMQGQEEPQRKKQLYEVQGRLKGYKVGIESDNQEIAKIKYLRQVEVKAGADNGVLKQYDKGIEDLGKRIEQYREAVKQSESDIAQLNKALQQIREAVAYYQNQISQLNQQIAQYQTQIAMLTAQKKTLEINLKHAAGLAIRQQEIKRETGKKVDAVHAEQGTVAG